MIQERLKALRAEMEKRGITVYVVPTADFHESEYVGDHFKARKFITGFTGSAGTAVITLDEAGLWTDGRYFVQAENQLKDSTVTLYRMGEEGVPTVDEFVKDRLKEGGCLGFDGRVVNGTWGGKLEKIAAEKAGIIKNGKPVVAVDEENGAFPVIERTAKEKNAPVYGLKSQELTILKKCENTIDFSINSRYYKISNLKVKSYASYQVQNAALAVLDVKVLLPEVSQDVIREGIVKMYWPGRMEEIAENVNVDGAQNPGAVHQIYNSLTDSDKEWLLLFAVCSDKDYSEMIRVLGRLPWKRIYITKIDSARGADTAAIKQC